MNLYFAQIAEKLMAGYSFEKITAIILRIGIGLTLIYASMNAIMAPQDWIGYVPQWVGVVISREWFLTVHSVAELGIGLGLLANLYTPVMSLLAFFDFSAILIFYGIDAVTFRDFGLAFAALALFFESLPRKERL